MSDKMSLSNFAAKVEWEGGLYDAVVGYGLSHEDINKDDNPEFYRLLKKYTRAARDVGVLGDAIEEMLEEFYDDYE